LTPSAQAYIQLNPAEASRNEDIQILKRFSFERRIGGKGWNFMKERSARLSGFIPAALCVAALFLGACERGAPAPGAQQSMVPEVGYVEIRPAKVTLTTELVGRTVSFLQAEVRPQVRGIIRGRHFVEGGDVFQGQVLYEIEPDSYQAAHDNAKAALAKAQATLEVTGLRARRTAELRKANAISQQDNDDAQAAHSQARAEVDACQAALAAAAINLDRTKITAPITGRISKSSVTVGALVTADQLLPLATIYQLDPMYVDVTHPADGLLRLRSALAGNDAGKSPDALKNIGLALSDGTVYAHTGKLEFTDVGVNEATGTVTLRVEFPNPDQMLLPGLYVRAVFREGENDQTLLVPQRSILRDNRGNPVVLVVTSKNTVERRPIRIGKNYGEDWIVLEGIVAGEKIIVDGLQKVRPGIEVRAVLLPQTPDAGKAPGPGSDAGPES
jgi:membrane fusion protein (multidrug efflux system)